MSVNSGTFLELFASHATPVVARDLLSGCQRRELARISSRRSEVFALGVSPLAPPYQIYAARASLYPDEHAA
jgi:hypothetical protein